jgi:hypothetical protein
MVEYFRGQEAKKMFKEEETLKDGEVFIGNFLVRGAAKVLLVVRFTI